MHAAHKGTFTLAYTSYQTHSILSHSLTHSLSMLTCIHPPTAPALRGQKTQQATREQTQFAQGGSISRGRILDLTTIKIGARPNSGCVWGGVRRSVCVCICVCPCINTCMYLCIALLFVYLRLFVCVCMLPWTTTTQRRPGPVMPKAT